MLSRFRTLALGALLLLVGATVAFAQQPTQPVDTAGWVVVNTKDGNEFFGTIRAQNEEAIVLKTEHFGELTLKRSVISSIRSTKKPKVVKGQVWFENPHAPRYFVGPSAYGLRKGEGVYDNSELFLSQVSYGFSDNFSLGVGFAPFFILFDGPFPIWLTPKFSFPIKKDKINVAFGGLFGREFNTYNDGNDYGASFNAAYFQSTYGSRDANITASLGFNFSRGQWSKRPIYSIAGTARLTPRIAFIGESYFMKDDYGDRLNLFGVGFRFMGRGIALDAGVAVMGDGYEVYPIPYGSLHVPFGSPKN